MKENKNKEENDDESSVDEFCKRFFLKKQLELRSSKFKVHKKTLPIF